MSFPKNLFLLFVLFVTVSVIGCTSSSDEEPTTLIQAINELDEASIFASWAVDPNVAAILSQSNQVIVVPSDEAIQSVITALNGATIPSDAIIDLVQTHVISGTATLTDGQSATSIGGVSLNYTGSNINGAAVLREQNISNEGTIILVNKVIIPNRIRLAYSSTNYQSNATTELQIGDNLSNLASYFSSLRPNSSGEMKGSTLQEVEAVLAPLREVSSVSFLDFVDTYYKAQLVDAANGGNFHPDSSSTYNGTGGGFTRTGSARYFYYKDGTEPQQIIEKGLYMATMYNQLYATLQNISSATPDKVIALVGATPAFANSASASENPDRLGANYFARRDKNESGVSGIYKALQYSISALNVAIAVNDSEAISRLKNEILLNYERGIIATVANYLHSTSASISKTAPTDNDLSAAMHAYSEALGFMMGFADLPTFADEAELGTIWNHMLQPDNTTGEFNVSLIATDRFNSVQRNERALDAIKAVYGFSTQEMEDFRFNWVNQQGR